MGFCSRVTDENKKRFSSRPRYGLYFSPVARLNKDDLAQMNKNYFQSLEKQRLVEVATNLHQLAVEQWEKLEENSRIGFSSTFL